MTEPRDRLYRQAVVDRLSSPDQLDQLIIIANARAWLPIAGLALLLSVALGWGIFGSIPTTVPAKGILVAEGGRVLAAMSPANGTLQTVSVRPGDLVRKGQPVATIRQAEAEQRLANARASLADRGTQLEERRAMLLKELELKRSALRQRGAAVRQSVAAAQERIAYLEKQLANRQEMLRMGFATAERIHEVQNELNQARKEAADGQAQLIALNTEEMSAQVATEAEIQRLQTAVTEVRQKVAEISTSLGETHAVLAPADGRVTEIKLTDGAVVGMGQPVLAIESAGARLQAVVYIPTEHGKKVKPGMAARISPATVKKEEWGMLLGKVLQVSSFPATRQGIVAVVQNDSLVDTYAKSGAPYEARLDLVPADTPSGHAWTSGQGPYIDLTTGTTIEAALTVREQRPIELVLPFLRQLVGGR